MSLAARWTALFPDLPAGAGIEAAGADLLARWSEPHRHYHTHEHLSRMLDVVDAYAPHADDVRAVRFACWFHDAIYDPTRPDNEPRSAALARSTLQSLGMPADEVERLVLLTATHDVIPGDRNGELIADADLAILAAEPPVYAEYTRQVRAEYAFVPDAEFAAGRAAILRRLLERPAVYRIAQIHDLWEARARVNLTAEIDALAAAGRTE